MRYGLPYMGSKNDLAKRIVDILPAIAAYVQSARAKDAMRTRAKRLEILLINPPMSARKAKRNRKRKQ